METVQQQVERIIDEGEGSRRRVIVQLGIDEDAQRRLIEVAAQVHQRRGLCISARDLLPARRERLEQVSQLTSASRRAAARRDTALSSVSLAAQLAVQIAPAAVVAAMINPAAVSALSLLATHDLVRKAVSEATATKRKKQKKDAPPALEEAPQFASSRAMPLDIHKDDLAKLPGEMPLIQDVFVNRMLRVPRLVEVNSDVPAVKEERASSWGLRRMGALSSWGAYGARGEGTRIAVLDTGVDANHKDLRGKVAAWAEFDEDGQMVPNSAPYDSDQHGTHCAGTIAGGNADGQYIGVAPDAKLAVALVLKGGSGTDAQVLAGMDWAIRQRVDAISMSLGGLWLDVEAPDPYTQALISALAVGIPVVTAIGNEGSQTTGSPANDWFAFAVGATDYQDRPAGFSGGRTHIIRRSRYIDPIYLPFTYSKPELAAPGVAIRSSVPNDKYAIFNGTSMATPHVAGAIALLLSATTIREAQLAPAEKAGLIQDLLTGSVEELGESGQDHRYGFGRLDILRAIGYAHELGYGPQA